MSSRTIKVETLARVEGEGALQIKLSDRGVSEVKLRIYEPPRFFEGLLRGRDYSEAPDITARICGICPLSYEITAVEALEALCGVEVHPQIRALRRLLYCGQWIESHALHIYLLHAPDFLGYEDAIRLAKDHPAAVQRGLSLKRTGNQILSAVAGREIHPINVRVGGFYRLPTKQEVAALREPVERAAADSLETVRFAGGLRFPEFEQNYEFVALKHPEEYAIDMGRIASNRGLDIPASAYEEHFAEEQVPHSTALHSYVKKRGPYVVGPLARYNLSFDQLSSTAQAAAREAGLGPVCLNPFKSIVVRAVEMLYACEEALRLIDAYEPPEMAASPVKPRAGTGNAATEAPRGLLYHRYTIDVDGLIVNSRIVPPTAQNQKSIESDLRALVPQYLDSPPEHLTWRCEQAIRNYDPCISCSAHFLRLELNGS